MPLSMSALPPKADITSLLQLDVGLHERRRENLIGRRLDVAAVLRGLDQQRGGAARKAN